VSPLDKLPGRSNPSAPAQTAFETLASLGATAEAGLSTAVATARLAQVGPNEVPERRDRPLVRFAWKFWGLSAWMIEIIVLISFILKKQADLWVALSLLLVNAVLSFVQEQHASTAVAALRARLQIMGRVRRDGRWQAVPARVLVSGDTVRVRAGDFVPADVQILDGVLGIDQSGLTGESREIQKTSDDAVYSGSLVREGEATAVRTFFGRTAELVESAQPKLHVEEVITRVVKWLFAIVGALVCVAVIASLIEGFSFFEILPLSLVLLMSAVPVALPVMFTVSMAVGAVELARRGVLITRLSAAEDAANMDVLCADKTGTLTANRLSITGALPVARVVAQELGLGEIVRAPDLKAAQRESQTRAAELADGSSGFAEVFPEDKFLVVKSLQAAGHVVGMTGDGVNDAPALRQAEVGIAVSGASDVAKGAASVVLTTEGLANIIDLVKNGRAIYQRVLTWIINKVSRTILKAGYVVSRFW